MAFRVNNGRVRQFRKVTTLTEGKKVDNSDYVDQEILEEENYKPFEVNGSSLEKFGLSLELDSLSRSGDASIKYYDEDTGDAKSNPVELLENRGATFQPIKKYETMPKEEKSTQMSKLQELLPEAYVTLDGLFPNLPHAALAKAQNVVDLKNKSVDILNVLIKTLDEQNKLLNPEKSKQKDVEPEESKKFDLDTIKPILENLTKNLELEKLAIQALERIYQTSETPGLYAKLYSENARLVTLAKHVDEDVSDMKDNMVPKTEFQRLEAELEAARLLQIKADDQARLIEELQMKLSRAPASSFSASSSSGSLISSDVSSIDGHEFSDENEIKPDTTDRPVTPGVLAEAAPLRIERTKSIDELKQQAATQAEMIQKLMEEMQELKSHRIETRTKSIDKLIEEVDSLKSAIPAHVTIKGRSDSFFERLTQQVESLEEAKRAVPKQIDQALYSKVGYFIDLNASMVQKQSDLGLISESPALKEYFATFRLLVTSYMQSCLSGNPVVTMVGSKEFKIPGHSTLEFIPHSKALYSVLVAIKIYKQQSHKNDITRSISGITSITKFEEIIEKVAIELCKLREEEILSVQKYDKGAYHLLNFASKVKKIFVEDNEVSPQQLLALKHAMLVIKGFKDGVFRDEHDANLATRMLNYIYDEGSKESVILDLKLGFKLVQAPNPAMQLMFSVKEKEEPDAPPKQGGGYDVVDDESIYSPVEVYGAEAASTPFFDTDIPTKLVFSEGRKEESVTVEAPSNTDDVQGAYDPKNYVDAPATGVGAVPNPIPFESEVSIVVFNEEGDACHGEENTSFELDISTIEISTDEFTTDSLSKGERSPSESDDDAIAVNFRALAWSRDEGEADTPAIAEVETSPDAVTAGGYGPLPPTSDILFEDFSILHEKYDSIISRYKWSFGSFYKDGSRLDSSQVSSATMSRDVSSTDLSYDLSNVSCAAEDSDDEGFFYLYTPSLKSPTSSESVETKPVNSLSSENCMAHQKFFGATTAKGGYEGDNPFAGVKGTAVVYGGGYAPFSTSSSYKTTESYGAGTVKDFVNAAVDVLEVVGAIVDAGGDF